MTSSEVERLAADLGARLGRPVATNVSLARCTTWRIGGPADLVVAPRSMAEVRTCLDWARSRGLEVTALGAGSNVLVPDGGIRGLVLRTVPGLKHIEVGEDSLRLGAGTLLARALRRAARLGWRGLEFAAGIPGTVGGAVLMNAGTREGSVGSRVREVSLIDGRGELRRLKAGEMVFSYRSSSLPRDGLVVEVVLALEPGEEPAALERQIRERLEARRRTQPQGPSAGSVFKNPRQGPPAGWLIEQVGAKGLRRGGAMVALEHANFIINTGGARAEDVLWLIAEVRRRVKDRFGIDLEPEVLVLGETRG
ncbi:MAG: UDP-N-acetylmuramate dehydrogenase [Clostridia bacterium]|nr:UDP-N-acetylmuramate dehydrogenase [Clostridia bacterium]